ncbi:MAG: M20 family metallopeptidase [Synergistaceae bacterium]|nr:M20 family metallopeptidase [Synergistaceae bacterium]
MNETLERIVKKVDQEELTAFLKKAVQIPSDIETPGEESELAHFIAEKMKAEGIETELQMTTGVTGESPNVIATLKGTGGKSVTFNGHIDAIPPLDMKDPYSGRIENGLLYGRGASDMKSGIIAMAYAMIVIKRSGVTLPGDLVLSAVVGEEYGSFGARNYVTRKPLPDYGVCGEPTGLKIGCAQKGLHWFEFNIPGKRVHSSVSSQGVNALKRLNQLMTLINEELEPKLNARTHHLLGSSLVNLGKVWGGEQPNVVPGDAHLQIERRYIPGETLNGVIAELQELVDKLNLEDPQYNITFESMPYSLLCSKTPMYIPEEHPIVQATRRAGAELGKEPEIIGVPFWGDAGVLYDAGVECILFGPGKVVDAHSATERVDLNDVWEAAKIYAMIPFLLGRN